MGEDPDGHPRSLEVDPEGSSLEASQSSRVILRDGLALSVPTTGSPAVFNKDSIASMSTTRIGSSCSGSAGSSRPSAIPTIRRTAPTRNFIRPFPTGGNSSTGSAATCGRSNTPRRESRIRSTTSSHPDGLHEAGPGAVNALPRPRRPGIQHHPPGGRVPTSSSASGWSPI
ncbi:MAG: hypothetical protein MZU84_01780 [Sphingobacterium sp.]|nr:hypothetical protein [Sphingobacterium sp.]